MSEERTGHNPIARKELPSEGDPAYTPLTQDGLSGLPALSPDLAKIVQAWDNLPLHIRTSILALVDAVAGK